MSGTRLRRASLALCAAEAGIAGYLTYVHYAGLKPQGGWGASVLPINGLGRAVSRRAPAAQLSLLPSVSSPRVWRAPGYSAYW